MRQSPVGEPAATDAANFAMPKRRSSVNWLCPFRPCRQRYKRSLRRIQASRFVSTRGVWQNCFMASSLYGLIAEMSSGSATNSTADWIARQVTEAFPWNEAPLHDPGPGSHLWYRRHTPIARQGIRDKPTAPASPWQKGFAERLIGSIRRECLDHVIVLDEPHLRRILKNYAMRLVITASELIGLCTRMRRSLGLSSIVRDGANDVLVRRPRTK